MKRFLIILLCLSMLVAMVSCTKTKDPTPEDTTAGEDTREWEEDSEERVYEYYAGKNFKGETITILNYESYCETNLEFAPEEKVAGDILNNAMFDRTAYVEEKLGVTIVEDRKGYADLGGWGGQANLGKLVENSVFSGTFQWDIANVFLNWSASLISGGYLSDMAAIDELHMDEDYWDTAIIEGLTINDKCYAASSQLTLMPFDLTWALFFNETMIDDLQLDSPYRLVDTDAWTLDKLYNYVVAGTSLNGDETFDYENINSQAICGIATHIDSLTALAIACDNLFLKTNPRTGALVANIETERLYDTIEKIVKIVAPSQGHSALNTSTPNNPTEPWGCNNLFTAGRALFLTGEIKSASGMRDMEDNFGVVPTPKFDEEQKNYYGVMGCPALLTIPTLQKDIHRTGLVLDALSFESVDVMDTYYNKIVTHRNVRNPESERMLNIIHDHLLVEFGSFFEFTSHYAEALKSAIRAEKVNLASLAETEVDTIEMRIFKFMEALEKQGAQ